MTRRIRTGRGASLITDLRTTDSAAEIGGKGASIAALQSLSLPTPDTRLVRTGVLVHHLVEQGMRQLALTVERDALTGSGADARAHKLRATLLESPLPSDLHVALEDELAAAPTTGLAIRSSATAESVRGASFAGQYETFLGISTLADAETAVRACWASLWSRSSLRYRAACSPSAPLGMAVLLQPLIQATSAGAALADDEVAVIEGTWGLGTGVMSGLVSPDRWTVDRDLRIRGREIGKKELRAVATDGNVEWLENVPALREAACLTDRLVVRVAALAFRAAVAFGGHVEMEWANERGRVLTLQARAVEMLGGSRASGPRESLDRPPTRGIPAAPGRATGPVRVARTAAEVASAGPTDVVIANYFSPAMAPAFKGAAIVSEAGGACSHAATIARERKIPLVVGLAGATRYFTDGITVLVDGSVGTVVLA